MIFRLSKHSARDVYKSSRDTKTKGKKLRAIRTQIFKTTVEKGNKNVISPEISGSRQQCRVILHSTPFGRTARRTKKEKNGKAPSATKLDLDPTAEEEEYPSHAVKF